MRRFMAATIIRHKSITTRWDRQMIGRISYWIVTTFGSAPFALLIVLAFALAILSNFW